MLVSARYVQKEINLRDNELQDQHCRYQTALSGQLQELLPKPIENPAHRALSTSWSCQAERLWIHLLLAWQPRSWCLIRQLHPSGAAEDTLVLQWIRTS